MVLICLSSGGNLTRRYFDHSNLFRSRKQYSVNIEHWLKYKVAWACVCKEYEVKLEMVLEQWLQLNMKPSLVALGTVLPEI